ncbi:MAG: hypothetical protein VZQ83_02085 [Eubacterium sp.]|nr:hypothetical protein [Eubacterium sp.]
MSIANSFMFTRTVVDGNKFLEVTHNQYKVVSVRPYVDKKGVLPDGLTFTLMVIKDDYDYGTDKNGKQRENNLFRNFDVTVFSRHDSPQKGDTIRLIDFDEENSFAINYDLLLRFKDFEIIKPTSKTA